MIIYPAIDIRNGKCVRLFQGNPEKETIYASNPVDVARRWKDEGAEWLHVVDLDGAFAGSPVNRELVISIAKEVDIPVQVGGGIRTEDDVAFYLASGVSRVIVGTRAFEDLDWFRSLCRKYSGSIALGLDARDGFVAIRGWKETTKVEVLEIIEQITNMPLGAIIYTDISRDGTHAGVNVDATEKLLDATHHPVIASGGVSSLEDVVRLLPLTKKGLNGVIIGRALYDQRIKLGEVLSVVKEYEREA
ncbi:MAG: 1-(5-phosphoribosyl)-5-[(5-phosphoribosylamino)methylideneamino]imidazole-4-carboxamide isomerase [Thermodesulforhabdaceae bacterium]|jgi:phosphoribosylformimino-5-aminoimidazole carboxamide ribotide isomerase